MSEQPPAKGDVQPVGYRSMPAAHGWMGGAIDLQWCERCGSLVSANTALHDAFHEQIDGIATRLDGLAEVNNLWDGS